MTPIAENEIKDQSENRVFGSYTRQDTGVEYSYEATWQESETGASWRGTVLLPTADVAVRPGSAILRTHGLDYSIYVRLLVEHSINDIPIC